MQRSPCAGEVVQLGEALGGQLAEHRLPLVHDHQRAPPPLEGLAPLLADHGVHQVEEGCAHEGGYVAADGSLGGGDQQDAAVMERLGRSMVERDWPRMARARFEDA